MPPVTDPPPPADPAVVARFHDALLGDRGNRHGHGPERDAAELVRRTWPEVGDGIAAADAFHSRAAARLAGIGAASAIFAGWGYPPPGELPHLRAARAVPGFRAGYSSGGESVTFMWHRALAGDPPAWLARGDRPGQVVGMARMAGLGGRMQAHLRLALHWLPPEYGPEVVAAWERALPPGSYLVMSAALPGPVPQPPEVRDAVTRSVAPSYQHSPEDIAGWVEAAGMELRWGVADLGLWPVRPAVAAAVPGRSPGWFAGAVALRP